MDRWMRTSTGKLGLAASTFAVALFVAGAAAAATDDDEPASKKAASVSAATGGATAAAAGGNDHDLWVGRLGFGWYGIGQVPIGVGAATGSTDDPSLAVSAAATLSAPAIGARYWLSPTMGIDGAIGFGLSSGQLSAQTSAAGAVGGGPACPQNASCTQDKVSTSAFFLHAGLPLVLGEGKHIAILAIPELNVGFASGTVKDYKAPGDTSKAFPDTSLSGFLLDIGARAGAEVYFGFIGIPQLALEGSIGAYYRTENTQVKVGSVSYKDSNTLISTSNINNPWDFFRSNVAARYYF